MARDTYRTWCVRCPMYPTETNRINSSFWHCKQIFLNCMTEYWLRLSLKGCICVFHLSGPYVCKWSVYINNPWANSLSQTSVADFWYMSLRFLLSFSSALIKTKQIFSSPFQPWLVHIRATAGPTPAICQSLLLWFFAFFFLIRICALFPRGIKYQTSWTLVMYISYIYNFLLQ